MVGDRVEVKLSAGWTPGVVTRVRDSVFTVDGRELHRVDVSTEGEGFFPACHPVFVRLAGEAV